MKKRETPFSLRLGGLSDVAGYRTCFESPPHALMELCMKSHAILS